MTTQDIYAWGQMGLQIVIGGGIVVGFSRYFGILRRAIEGQKATIEAQAEQMKAQSTVLQDVERLNKVMQQVIVFFDPQAQLQREQAYKQRVERDIEDLKAQHHALLAQQRARMAELEPMARKLDEEIRLAKEEKMKHLSQAWPSPGHELTAGSGPNDGGNDQP
jgi:uncharacterized membrane protein YgaE (UPF0421/DUF939 family)